MRKKLVIFLVVLVALLSYSKDIDPQAVSMYEKGMKLIKVNSDNEKYKESAIKYFEKATNIDPYYIAPYYQLAFINKYFNERERAIEYYKKVIDIDPNYKYACDDLSTLYFDKVSEGIDYFEEQNIIYPNTPSILTGLASLCDDNEEAIKLVEKTLNINPNYAPAYALLGDIYFTMMEEDKGIKFIKKSIEIDPNFHPAYRMMYYLYDSLGTPEKGNKYLIKAAKLGNWYSQKKCDELSLKWRDE